MDLKTKFKVRERTGFTSDETGAGRRPAARQARRQTQGHRWGPRGCRLSPVGARVPAHSHRPAGGAWEETSHRRTPLHVGPFPPASPKFPRASTDLRKAARASGPTVPPKSPLSPPTSPLARLPRGLQSLSRR